MEKLIFYFLFMGICSILGAQTLHEETLPNSNVVNSSSYERKVQIIDKEELPEGLQRVISNGEFRKWEIDQAYMINEDENNYMSGEALYIVTVKRRFDHFALYYSGHGKLIRQERMGF